MNEGLESLQAEVRKLTAMVEENHSMLKSIQRRARFSLLISSIKWLFILGITFGSFIYLQPYLDSLLETYSSFSNLSNPFSTSGTEAAPEGNDGLINAMRAYMPR